MKRSLFNSLFISLIFSLSLLSLAACNYAQYHEPGNGAAAQDVPCPPANPGSGTETVFYEDVREAVFAPKCFRCHSGSGGAGGVLLDTYAAAKARASQIEFDVVNNIMPKAPNPPLSQAEKGMVSAWVKAGAPSSANAAACPSPDPNPSPSPTPAPTPVPLPAPVTSLPNDAEINFTFVKDRIFALHCLGCHSGPNSADGFDLTSYGEVIDEIDDLEEVLEEQRMPPRPRPLLSEVEKQVVFRWIELGAPR